MRKRILVYGDSNAWGFIPGIGTRYDEDKRWPGVLASCLGDSYEVVEDCISGRTTSFDDPSDPLRNGLAGLGYSLNAHAPLDMIIIHLGVNDLKFTDAKGTAESMKKLVKSVINADSEFPLPSLCPHYPGGLKLLIVSPVHVHGKISSYFPQSGLASAREESLKLAESLKGVSDELGTAFLDASSYASPCVIDCLHMDAKSHIALGEITAELVKQLL